MDNNDVKKALELISLKCPILHKIQKRNLTELRFFTSEDLTF
jgi:hypothetical protein